MKHFPFDIWFYPRVVKPLYIETEEIKHVTSTSAQKLVLPL